MTPAQALPSKSGKLAQARAVKSQLDRLDGRVEIATEKYNDARLAHGKIMVKKRKAAARVAKAEKRIGQLQRHLGTRANGMYRSGASGILDVLLGSQSFEDFATTWDLLKDLNKSDARSVAEMKAARAEAKAAHAELALRERSAATQVAIMGANKRSIERQIAERKRMLSGLESQIAAIERAEEAAARARAASWVRSSRSRGGSHRYDNVPTPSHPARSQVVPYAKQFLGRPYVWGAAGPNSFDCSGFTMYVYRHAAGISLPHSSRAQFGCGERVSRADLAPGDLVFFGSPIHHVGIYVGGGMFIHAPHTGDVVKISSLAGHGGYAGAVRP